MVKPRALAVMALSCLSLTHAAVAEVSCSDLQDKGLACFRSGDVARADDINHNFDKLLKQLDELEALVERLRKGQDATTQRLKQVDGLARDTKAVKAGVDGLKKSQQSTTQSLNRLVIGECKAVKGSCGTGMFKQPLHYMDRVRFSCPAQSPVLRSLKFVRCGKRGTSNEGLLLEASCCKLRK